MNVTFFRFHLALCSGEGTSLDKENDQLTCPEIICTLLCLLFKWLIYRVVFLMRQKCAADGPILVGVVCGADLRVLQKF